MRPRVFFVGDNRNNPNWGRGASIALRELLGSTFEISGTVDSDWFDPAAAEAAYVGMMLPERHYRHFRYAYKRRARRPFSWYLRLEQLFGARDFVGQDPAASVDTLMEYKERVPALGRLFQQAAEADMMVIDGDGDIIFSTPPRRTALFFLVMMELGVRLKKPVFLVNSMISDCPISGRNEKTLDSFRRLLEKCSGVMVRDPESDSYIKAQMPNVESSVVPDSLFWWYSIYQGNERALPADGNFALPFPERDEYWGKLDFSQPYVCIGGGSLASWNPERARDCYSKLVDAVQSLGLQIILTENDLPDSYLHQVAAEKRVGIIAAHTSILTCGAVLANARLFISGRYHPSILASLGGTPCIFLGTDSHKCGSISRVLDYEVQRQFDAFPDEKAIEEIVALGKDYLSRGDALRSRVSDAARARCNEVAALPSILARRLHG